MSRSNEFEFIKKILAPLSKGSNGAFDLTDDAALLPPADYIVTKDMLIGGVHFLPKDPLDLVARKLMRVNLSDLAAKGARPAGYFLACAWPMNIKERQLELFAEGLREDQAQFKVALYGGDTTVHRAKSAPLTLSATFFGAPARSGIIRRNGAKPGDDLYVSGTIGDAGLGLRALTKVEKFPASDKKYLVERYQLPTPRLALGGAIAGLASAAIDVSDGLLADAAHLAVAAGARIIVKASDIPISPAAQTWCDEFEDPDECLSELVTFGDDYEILFTAPQSMRRSVEMAGTVSKTPVKRIGTVTRGEGVALSGTDDEIIEIDSAGFDHFAG